MIGYRALRKIFHVIDEERETSLLPGSACALEGRELAQLALLTHRKLEWLEGQPIAPRFALAGSVLMYVTPVRNAVMVTLREHYPHAVIHTEPAAPVLGALLRARHAHGTVER